MNSMINKSSTQTHIDVIVFYTDTARLVAGGVSAIENTINSAVSQANQSHSDSGSQARLRLVRTQEVSYVETGDLGLDLFNLGSTDDLQLQEVHDVRDQYGADLVHLIVESNQNSGSTVGIAYNPGQFGVTTRSYALQHVFSHEIGHNIGLCHQYGVDANSNCNDDDVPNHAFEATADFYNPIGIYCGSGRVVTVMWNSISSNMIGRFSDPNGNVDFSPPFGCLGASNIVTPLGDNFSQNRGMINLRRSISAYWRNPHFYVQVGGADGNATELSPENDIGDVLAQWYDLTEAHVWGVAENESEFRIGPGTYPEALTFTEPIILKRWGPSGVVNIGAP